MPNSPRPRDDDVPSARPKFVSEPANRRPGHVLGAAILLVVSGALGVLYSWYQLSQLGAYGDRVPTGTLALAWVLIILAGTQIVSGVYVLPGRNWRGCSASCSPA